MLSALKVVLDCNDTSVNRLALRRYFGEGNSRLALWDFFSSEDDLKIPENDCGHLFGRPDVALATLSVWESFEDFEHFVHKTIHGQFLNRRAEWFEHVEAPSYVIWPIAAGHIPNLVEGRERLMLLRENGPIDEAYDFSYRA